MPSPYLCLNGHTPITWFKRPLPQHNTKGRLDSLSLTPRMKIDLNRQSRRTEFKPLEMCKTLSHLCKENQQSLVSAFLGGASGAIGGPVAPTGQGGLLATTGGNATVSIIEKSHILTMHLMSPYCCLFRFKLVN